MRKLAEALEAAKASTIHGGKLAQQTAGQARLHPGVKVDTGAPVEPTPRGSAKSNPSRSSRRGTPSPARSGSGRPTTPTRTRRSTRCSCLAGRTDGVNLQQAIDAREKTRRDYERKLEAARQAKAAAERRKLAETGSSPGRLASSRSLMHDDDDTLGWPLLVEDEYGARYVTSSPCSTRAPQRLRDRAVLPLRPGSRRLHLPRRAGGHAAPQVPQTETPMVRHPMTRIGRDFSGLTSSWSPGRCLHWQHNTTSDDTTDNTTARKRLG